MEGNRYFGAPWNPNIAKMERAATPIGEACWHCDEPIEDGDQGEIMPLGNELRPIHLDCFLRRIVGSVGHQKKTCSCFGGEVEDPPGLTIREAARAAVAYYEAQLPCSRCGETNGHADDCAEMTDTPLMVGDPDGPAQTT